MARADGERDSQGGRRGQLTGGHLFSGALTMNPARPGERLCKSPLECGIVGDVEAVFGRQAAGIWLR